MAEGRPPVSVGPVAASGKLETALADRRRQGHKLLVPYVTGGMDDEWLLDGGGHRRGRG